MQPGVGTFLAQLDPAVYVGVYIDEEREGMRSARRERVCMFGSGVVSGLV